MDDVFKHLSSKETKKRLLGISLLKSKLENGDSCAEVFPALANCLKDNSAIVCLGSLECILLLLQREGTKLRSMFNSVAGLLIERMGDGKLQVREKSLEVIMEFIQCVGTSGVMEKLQVAFQHKNHRVREQMILCLAKLPTWNSTEKPLVDHLISKILDLLEDSNKDVRAAVMIALEAIYQQLGTVLMDKIQQRKIRPMHLREIEDRLRSITVSSDKTQKISVVHDPVKFNRIRSTPFPGVQSSSTTKEDEGIVPLTVDSEKQLAKEMESIANELATSDDWNCRVEALRKIQRLACGNAPSFDSFIGLIKKMEKPIKDQIKDLRSSVVKEACGTVSTLAQCLGDSFDILAELFVDSLLKLTIVTISVICQSGDSTLRKIIESTTNGFPRMLPKLIDGARSRNQLVRACCTTYLAMICETWNQPCIDRYCTSIMELLPSVLCDALGTVRTSARQCYWSFARRYPIQAKMVMEKLDLNTQRNVYEDESAQVPLVLKGTKQNNVYTQQHEYASTNSDVLRKPLRLLTPSPHEIPLSQQTSANRVVPLSNLKVPPPATTTSGPRRIETSSATETGIHSRFLSSGALRVEIERRAHLQDKGPPLSHHPHPPHHMGNANSSSNNNNGTGGCSGPQRVVQPWNTTSGDSTTATAVSLYSGGAKRIPRHDDATQNPSHHRNRPRPATGMGTAMRVVLGDGAESNSHQQGDMEIQDPKEKPNGHVSIPALLEKASDPLWSKRVECFEELGMIMKDGKRSSDIKTNADAIARLFVDYIADGHHKVSQAALDHLGAFFSLVPHQAETSLVFILPKIFAKLADPKESIRTSANRVLMSIKSNYDESLLLSIVLNKMIDSNSGNHLKVKVVMYEFILYLLPKCTAYFQNALHLRHLVLRVAQLLNDKKAQLRKLAAEILSLLHCQNDGLEASLLHLPSNLQFLVLKCIRSSSSDPDPTKKNLNKKQDTKEQENVLCGTKKEKDAIHDTKEQQDVLHDTKEQQDVLHDHGIKVEEEEDFPEPMNIEPNDPTESWSSENVLSSKEMSLNWKLVYHPPVGEGKNRNHHEIVPKILDALQRGKSSKKRDRALSQLIALSEDPQVFLVEANHQFPKLLECVLDILNDNEPSGCQLAIHCIRCFVRYQTSLMLESFETVALMMLDCYRNKPGIVAYACEKALLDLVERADSHLAIRLLLHLISKEDMPLLLVLLCLLAHGIKTSDPVEISELLQKEILPPLFKTFNHNVAEVRKNVVCCLVELHYQLGDALFPHLDSLCFAKKELVSVYIHRAKLDRPFAAVS